MTTGLPVSRIVRATVTLTPSGAQAPNLNSLLILGDSDVIDTDQRIRSYGGIDEIATDFGTTAPEYLAAVLFFGQKPQPTQVYVGRWAWAATAGRLLGAPLTAAQKALANFTAITTGALKLTIDGAAAVTISALNFSGATNLNGVASIINAALTGATCVWDGARFVIKSASTGAASAIGFPTAPASGTDIKALIGMTAALGARAVTGIVAETALQAVTILDQATTYWYGMTFASTHLTDPDIIAVAGYIEAAERHMFGATTSEATAVDSTSSADIGSQLKALGYTRTFVQYSTSSAYAAASMFGRILTTNFQANNSVITLMFKQEPGVIPETLSTNAADALDAKRYNYFAYFNNETAIIVNGMCSGDAFIDEVYGTDWLAADIQTSAYNLLYTSPTKIPQTDEGNHLIKNTIDASCARGVVNGLIAPGQWNSAGFGQLAEGDYMPTGFYTYAPPIALQAQQERAARKAVPFQTAIKLAGAIHDLDVAITVNR